jgi:hypothetical protein
MKNMYLIIGIIVIILLLGGGWYYMNMMRPNTSNSNQKTGTIENQETGSGMTSLKDLLSMGKNQKCTYKYSDPTTGTMEGVTYISTSGKMRGDYTGTDPAGKTFSGHMINDTQFMYTWSSQTPQGMKIPITEDMKKTVDDAQKNPQDYQKYVNTDAKMAYDCDNWNGDASVFTPPSDVQFTDLSEQMKVIEDLKGNPDMKKAQCTACDYMQGEEQTKCKTSLGCE